MKKILSLLLAICLLAPAAALADTRDDLNDITQKVVDLLEIGDDYIDFSGDYIDGTRPYWSLGWTKDDASLFAQCSDDGLILGMQRSDWAEDDSDSFYGYDPSLPEVSRDSAAEQAAYWCGRLLDGDETVSLDDGSYIRYTGEWSFTGNVLKNGLPSPITVALRINEKGLASYQRSDEYDPVVGETPSAVPAVSEDDAAALLAGTVSLACRYKDMDGSGTARLVWMPVSDDTYVDAQTGDIVFFGTGFEIYDSSVLGMYESAQADGEYTSYRELTETELAAIDTYDGVLTETEIDALLRDIALLGLDGFELTACSFSMENGSDRVEADLTYIAQLDEEHLYGFSTEAYGDAYYGDTMQVYCYITVDAFTGLPLSVSRRWPMEAQNASEINLDAQELTDAAETFIAQCTPDYADSVAQDDDNSCRYLRTENGYPYPANYLYVDVNSVTGTVDDFEIVWDDEETFAEPVAPVDGQTAKDAYLVPAETELGYVDEYVDTDDFTAVRELKLAWYFTGTDNIIGIDAETGEVLYTAGREENTIAYSDIDDCPQRESIQTLAEVGVGFSGGTFEPDSTLTVRDAAILLLQSDGTDPDGSDDEQLLEQAAAEGFLPDGVSADDPVTAGMFLRMMLAPSRYGYTAALTGIWSDVYESAGEYSGYAAVAAGLGILPENTDLTASLTRAGAAEILCGFMDLA